MEAASEFDENKHSASTDARNTENNEQIQDHMITSTNNSIGNVQAATSDEGNEISKSTVMITTSQIMSNGSEKFIDLSVSQNADKSLNDETTATAAREVEEDEKNSAETMSISSSENNTSSMVFLPSMSHSMPSHDENVEHLVDENIGNDEKVVHDQTTSNNEQKGDIDIGDDYLLRQSFNQMSKETSEMEMETLVKDYAIPNFENSMKSLLDADLTSSIEPIKTEVEKMEKNVTDKRLLENETFQEILGNGSLQKKITQYGDQSLPEFSRRPVAGQMVTISYDAYLKDTLQLVDHNDNLSFILGDGDVISGLDMIVSLMDKNEKCEMIAESRHAFGSLGKQPDIPPDSTLLYKIHLKDFSDLTDMNLMLPVERLSLAEAKKLRGNYHYNRQDFALAIRSYKKGIAYFNEENLKGDEEDQDLKKFQETSQALLMNLALSYYKIGECREALDTLDQVLKAQNKHVKALYIKGKILLQLGETKEAIKALESSLQIDSNNQDVKKELAKAQAKYKIQYDNEKKMYKKMISAVGKTEEDMAKINKKATRKNDKDSSNYITYIVAGLAIAVASVGVALFARSKNVI